MPAFTEYTIFGLTEAGDVVFVEKRSATGPTEAIARARARLDECHMVEVWAEAVRIHREKRRP